MFNMEQRSVPLARPVCTDAPLCTSRSANCPARVGIPALCRCCSSGSRRAGQILSNSPCFALQVEKLSVLPRLKPFVAKLRVSRLPAWAGAGAVCRKRLPQSRRSRWASIQHLLQGFPSRAQCLNGRADPAPALHACSLLTTLAVC